jgi:hypothetical protein
MATLSKLFLTTLTASIVQGAVDGKITVGRAVGGRKNILRRTFSKKKK